MLFGCFTEHISLPIAALLTALLHPPHLPPNPPGAPLHPPHPFILQALFKRLVHSCEAFRQAFFNDS